MKLRHVIWSWDFAIACFGGMALWIFGPKEIPHRVAGDFYSVGISVLAIMFSVFFAALANIMSTSDNQFVKFLEETAIYTALIAAFKITLGLLFLALLYSLGAYIATSIGGSEHGTQNSIWMVLFLWVFVWGLLAAFSSANDAIKFAQKRAEFLRISL